MNTYKLFLDDIRDPRVCVSYMKGNAGFAKYFDTDWVIVRNYEEFVQVIEEKGLPYLISFDHDLSWDHYNIDFDVWDDYSSEQLGVEKTGADCAEWLKNYCIENNLKLPEFYVHSMNPVGRENIKRILYEQL